MCTVGLQVTAEGTVSASIFAGFNVCGFRKSAAIREYIVCEYLDVTVNGQVHSSSQSMTSCATKMVIIGLRLLLPVTSQDMDPHCCRKSVQTYKIVHSTWPTVSAPLFIATANGSSLLLHSQAQPSLSPMKGVHISL